MILWVHGPPKFFLAPSWKQVTKGLQKVILLGPVLGPIFDDAGSKKMCAFGVQIIFFGVVVGKLRASILRFRGHFRVHFEMVLHRKM